MMASSSPFVQIRESVYTFRVELQNCFKKFFIAFVNDLNNWMWEII